MSHITLHTAAGQEAGGDRARAARRSPGGWTAGRVASAAGGCLLVLASLGVLGLGAAGASMESTGRHGDYVILHTDSYRTADYALADATLLDDEVGVPWDSFRWLFGSARVRVTSGDPGRPVFVGLARPGQAAAYLSGVAHAAYRDPLEGVSYTPHDGAAPRVLPGQAGIWAASASGTGTQTVVWPGESGLTLVEMNADGSRGVDVQVEVAATMPSLAVVATLFLVLGLAGLVGGVALVVVPVRRVRRH